MGINTNEVNINYYDNVIPFKVRHGISKMCLSSSFYLGWGDRATYENVVENSSKSVPCLHSMWSEETINLSGILPYVENCIDQTPWFKYRNLHKVILNLTKSNDVHYHHVHHNQHAVLYYVNLDWEDGWYGETLFYNPENLEKVVFTSLYKPGRMILFDGHIPHAIRPQSVIAPRYRMSLTLFFNDGNS